MKIFIYLALVALVASAPTSNEIDDDDNLTIDRDFYDDQFKIYTSEHEITKIHLPVNALNMGDDNDEEETDGRVVFFVEAGKGVSVLFNDKYTSLVPTGTSITSGVEDIKIAYIGATDGIYFYNNTLNKAVKYGTITDNIVEIVKIKASDDDFYILTIDNDIYKVTENATKKELVDVGKAIDISVDNEKNLYFITKEKQVKVLSNGVVTVIEGFPASDKMKLVQPAFIQEGSIGAISNNNAYFIAANGTYELYANFQEGDEPSAVSVDGALILYMAKDKSLYEYNVLAIIFQEDILGEVRRYLNDKTDQIEQISTRSRSDIKYD